MALNLAQKLIQSHLRQGGMQPGDPIAIAIDQTLTQDATGTPETSAIVCLQMQCTRNPAARNPERARTAANVISMGALIEATGGVAAIVLGILGLAGLLTNTMLAVITIVIGVALVLQGMEITAEYSAALANGDDSAIPASRGMTIELLVGGAGIVLGILALAVNAHVLVPAALIVFGGSLLLAGVAGAQMFPSDGAHREAAEDHVLEVARQSRSGAAGVQVMVGIAAIILGILAYLLPSVAPTLALVGLIAVGGSLLLTSAAATTFAELITRPARWHRGEPTQPAVGEPGE